jgi:hypothetical protein
MNIKRATKNYYYSFIMNNHRRRRVTVFLEICDEKNNLSQNNGHFKFKLVFAIDGVSHDCEDIF